MVELMQENCCLVFIQIRSRESHKMEQMNLVKHECLSCVLRVYIAPKHDSLNLHIIGLLTRVLFLFEFIVPP